MGVGGGGMGVGDRPGGRGGGGGVGGDVVVDQFEEEARAVGQPLCV